MALFKYLEVIWRRKMVLIISFLILVVLPLYASKKMDTIYSATAKIMINQKDIKPELLTGAPEDIGKFYYIQEKNVIDTYQTLIKNRTIIDPVIKELNLKNKKGELIESDSLFVDTLNVPKLLFSQLRGVRIAQIESSEIFSITAYAPSVGEALTIANRVCDKTLEFYYNLNSREMKKAAEVLRAKLNDVNGNLKKYERERSELLTKEGSADLSTKKETLEEQLVSLESKLPSLKVELTENHPDVVAVEKQIEETKKSIALIPEVQMKIDRLRRIIDELETSYKAIDQQIVTAEVLSAMDVSNIIMIEKAKPSFDPSNDIFLPRKGLVGIIGGALSLIMGFFFIFTLEYFDTSYKTVDEVRRDLGRPILGIIPLMSWPLIRWVSIQWNTRFLDSMGNIASGLSKRGNKVIGVFSPTQRDGKSVVASYVSRMLAERKLKVLLVDMDFFQSSLRRYFFIRSKPGLRDVLEKRVLLDRAIKNTRVEGLYILPLGKGRKLPSVYLESPEFRELLLELKKDYDFIVMDCSSLVKKNIFTNILAGFVESSIFVVSLLKTDRNHAIEASKILEESGINITGLAINRVRNIRSIFGFY